MRELLVRYKSTAAQKWQEFFWSTNAESAENAIQRFINYDTGMGKHYNRSNVVGVFETDEKTPVK